MPPTVSQGPLAGLRVIDASTVLAGPYATMVLGDLGADVIKIEPPDGDATRNWGPPWVGDVGEGTRTAAYYLAVNRNKRSLCLDLKAVGGADVLRRLLRDADVFVENLRPGSLERLGFGDDALRELAPDLVHLAISGYGREGPAADRPGYDFVIQAMSGLMSITGEPAEAGGQPTKVGVAISDVVTGLYSVIGILAALLTRSGGGGDGSRGAVETGGAVGAGRGVRGQRVDASLLGSTLAVLVNQAQNAFVAGSPPGRMGNAHPNIVPYESFATADGEIAVAVGSERQWPRLCAALDLHRLAADPRFASNGARVERRVELRAVLADQFARQTSEHWVAALERADVPVGAVRDVSQAFASPEAEALGMAASIEHPALGVLRQAGIPLALSATPGSIRTPPPLLGEHTEDILRELGYDRPAIARLHAAGTIQASGAT